MKRRAIAAIGILSMVLASFFLGRALVFREPAVQAQAAVLTAPEADPIDAFLLERQQLRQMQIAQLNELNVEEQYQWYKEQWTPANELARPFFEAYAAQYK